MEQILQTIRYNNGNFPEQELQQIIERQEEATPYLLQTLNELKEDYKKVMDQPSRIDYVYAYFLLAQFKVKEQFPILIDLLSMPSDVSDYIFGDSIAEDMGSILASSYNGDSNLLFTLIENSDANEYARGQAVIALVVLVFDGQLSREVVMDYFKQLLASKRTETDYYLNAEIACCCNSLYPEEVYEEIKCIYDEGRIEEFIIGMDSINRTLKRTKENVLESNKQDPKFQLITNTIKKLKGWGCFRQEKLNKSGSSFIKLNRSNSFDNPTINPAVMVEKMGRNDPCTCGSGKKYKKCCGK